jgi:hypothetical protein
VKDKNDNKKSLHQMKVFSLYIDINITVTKHDYG